VRTDARLAIAMASAAGFSGRFDRIDALLDLAERNMTDDLTPPHGWRTAAGAINTLRASFGRALDPSAAVDVARRAVALECDPSQDGYAISRLTLGIVLAGTGTHDEALPLLDEAGQVQRRGAGPAQLHATADRGGAGHDPSRCRT
jgi:ATP/maltotriose-dependent transcriptional regulator MalT